MSPIDIVIILVVIAIIANTLWRGFRKPKNDSGGGCHSGCDSCPSTSSCKK